MKKVVSVEAAKTNLSKLIREVEAGADVTISRAGNPVIRLVKYEEETKARKLGFAKGEISDLSDSDWEELDTKFRALFELQKVSAEVKQAKHRFLPES
jgi:prevent-host-death family protein